MAATIGAAALLVAVCWFGATTKAPPAWEISVFDFFNTLPSPVGNALAALMWFGTTVGILIAALAASLWKRNDISTHVLLAGLLAWLTQRSLKPLVDRGRPRDLLAEANFHGHLASGGGIPSGHTAMAVAICAAVAFHVSRPWRAALALLAGAIGIARMYTGNHFPLDIVAGAALGWVCAVAAHYLIGAWERRRPRSSGAATS
ncbi:MAG: phosphatase PAP2 family protein [Microthrixaceae bacterium]|nr:phosphatase PAP2 family protein [Microthrixaceae bacterium]MCO5311577.1 phosphatase PAP2 family protein [Microthrixaceae bacterium]